MFHTPKVICTLDKLHIHSLEWLFHLSICQNLKQDRAIIIIIKKHCLFQPCSQQLENKTKYYIIFDYDVIVSSL